MAEELLEGKKSNKKSSSAPPGTFEYGQYSESDTKSKNKLNVLKFYPCQDADVFCVRFDEDDQLLAAGCSDGSVKIINLEKDIVEHVLSAYSALNYTPTTSLRWRPTVLCKTKKVLVSVNSDGTVIHWHGPSGKQLHKTVENDNSVLCLDYNRDGSQFATSGKDYHVRVYDEDTKSVVIDFSSASWNLPGHANRVFAVKFLPNDQNVLLSGGWDSSLHIWDIREKKSIGTIYGPSISGDSLDVKDNVILTGSYRNEHQVQLWDFNTRKLIKDIPWNNDCANANQAYVYSAQYSKIPVGGSRTFAVGSTGLNQMVLHDSTNDNKPCASLVNLHDGVYSIDYCNKSNRLAFGGAGGTYLVQVNTLI